MCSTTARQVLCKYWGGGGGGLTKRQFTQVLLIARWMLAGVATPKSPSCNSTAHAASVQSKWGSITAMAGDSMRHNIGTYAHTQSKWCLLSQVTMMSTWKTSHMPANTGNKISHSEAVNVSLVSCPALDPPEMHAHKSHTNTFTNKCTQTDSHEQVRQCDRNIQKGALWCSRAISRQPYAAFPSQPCMADCLPLHSGGRPGTCLPA